VHAGIIEPGHFRFQAVGEEVLRLEERLGYVHKGIEKIAVDRDPAGLVRLAGGFPATAPSPMPGRPARRWSGRRAAKYRPRPGNPARVMAERERIANHLGDIGAICNDVGFAFAHVQCAALREQWQRRSRELFGHRLMMDTVIPGGVAATSMPTASRVRKPIMPPCAGPLSRCLPMIDDTRPLEDRLQDTGVLAGEDARALGCTGYVGKASGLTFDARRDSPYAPYDRLDVTVPAIHGRVMWLPGCGCGCRRSFHLWMLERLLDALPPAIRCGGGSRRRRPGIGWVWSRAGGARS
jgi:Ni,Fe-hydrogenase III large subunit